MQISVTDAKAQLTELLRRAEAGEEIVLTRHGQPAGKIVPIQPKRSREGLRETMAEIQRSVAAKLKTKFDAARSADFLYDDKTGLPK